MNISVIAAAKIPATSSVKSLIDDYLKRLTTIKVNIIDFEEKKLDTQKINAKIFTLVPSVAYKIMLDEKGKLLSTVELHTFLQSLSNYKSIAFLIGGADGFLPEYKKQSDTIISLSPLTFPHKLARLILIEQLYRIQTLTLNHPYHR